MRKAQVYIAYGSNMDFRQMDLRCPRAYFIGTGYIEGYELLFKGRRKGSYATIEKADKSIVPVHLWEISRSDEQNLDWCEGYPHVYYKKTLPVQTEDGTIKGMVYIMHEEHKLGIPTDYYYNMLQSAYKRCGWDISILKKAMEKSAQAINLYAIKDI